VRLSGLDQYQISNSRIPVTEYYGPFVSWSPILYYYADSATAALTSLASAKYGVQWFSDGAHFALGLSETIMAVCIMDGGYPRVISTLSGSSLTNAYDYFTVFDDGTNRLISLGSTSAANNTYLVKVASDWSMSLAAATASTVAGYAQSFSPSGTYLQRGTQVMAVDLSTGATSNAVSLPYTGACYRCIWVDDTHIICPASALTIGLYSFSGSAFTLIGSAVGSGWLSSSRSFLSADKGILIKTYVNSSTGTQIYSVSTASGLSALTSLPCSVSCAAMRETDTAYYLIGSNPPAYYPYSQMLKIDKLDYTMTAEAVNIANMFASSIAYNSGKDFYTASGTSPAGQISPILGEAQAAYLWQGTFAESGKLVEVGYNGIKYFTEG
jgi:hypothetical protein